MKNKARVIVIGALVGAAFASFVAAVFGGLEWVITGVWPGWVIRAAIWAAGPGAIFGLWVSANAVASIEGVSR